VSADEVRRIGITTRVVQADGYDEPRDALAQDWGRFMAAALPDAAWTPVPNLGVAVVEHVKRLQLNALVLSGGEDLGVSPERDETELSLLRHALGVGMPVLGVCRGLQLMQMHFGGALVVRTDRSHVATRHTVCFERDPRGSIEARTEPLSMRVNSFHANSIRQLAPPLEVLAKDDEGAVEAAESVAHRLLGLMWHPEREAAPSAVDTALLRSLFELEGGS